VCANECPHGSARGALGNWRPYRNVMVAAETTTEDEEGNRRDVRLFVTEDGDGVDAGCAADCDAEKTLLLR
jgi:hypothetical protein